jgi:hypothetical protein
MFLVQTPVRCPVPLQVLTQVLHRVLYAALAQSRDPRIVILEEEKIKQALLLCFSCHGSLTIIVM